MRKWIVKLLGWLLEKLDEPRQQDRNAGIILKTPPGWGFNEGMTKKQPENVEGERGKGHRGLT